MSKPTFHQLVTATNGQTEFEQSVLETFNALSTEEQKVIKGVVKHMMIAQPMRSMGFQSYLCLATRVGIYLNDYDKDHNVKKAPTY
jgi:hypothetical protein